MITNLLTNFLYNCQKVDETALRGLLIIKDVPITGRFPLHLDVSSLILLDSRGDMFFGMANIDSIDS